MKTFFALALAGAVSAAPLNDIEHKFMGYMTQYGKSYGTIAEYAFRLEQFTRNHIAVVEHNADETQTFKLGYNHMSDWTQEEYSHLLTYTPYTPEEDAVFATFDENAVPNAVDWVSAGAVNAIKNQGQCGSCWAFSAAGTLESAWKIKSGTLYNFSEQQLVDCSTANHGCNGGWQYQAYNYYKSNFAMTQASYPYKAVKGTCKYSSSNTGKGTTGYVNVAANNSTAMKSALAGRPLAVSIEADKAVFQNYASGIFNSTACGTNLDHAVIVVGWGTSGSTEYWTVRNSWGTSWGERGYIRIAITSGAGICGVQMQPLYPSV